MARKHSTSSASRSVNYSSSPLLAARTPAGRSRAVVFIVALAFSVLAARAAYVQVINPSFFQRQGEIRYARTIELTASRGRILDRNGILLAVSVPAPSIWAIPKDLEASSAQRVRMARALGMSLQDLESRLDDNPNFVWLKRQVDEETAQKVRDLGVKGVYQVKEFRRQYPEGEAAAHVVGFTNVEDRGQEGIELAFQPSLEGRSGSRRVIKDRLGRVVEDIGDQVDPMHGQDIRLSLDSKAQFFAFQQIREAVMAHKAKAGSVVVLDAKSGEILALANYPSYSPSDRKGRTGQQVRNRALTDVFEPGSTMKPFVAALALETGRVKPSTVIGTAPGRISITGSTITDAHTYGDLTVQQIIQKSSNVGTVKMALQMAPREMHELYASVGLGQKPPLGFPGLASGKLRPWKSWKPIEQATMSYGYGLSASLLQLARAYTAFAHDGEVMPLTMLHDEKSESASGARVFSAGTAREIRKMLQMAAGEGGTAPLAQTIGYSVGGKSGTARKQEGKGYADKKYRSWFVGLAPISEPRIVVAVMVDEPSNGQFYGGTVAAPVFSAVVQQTLRALQVPPDLEVKPQIVARQWNAVEESF